jgi:hypothetical protein
LHAELVFAHIEAEPAPPSAAGGPRRKAAATEGSLFLDHPDPAVAGRLGTYHLD